MRDIRSESERIREFERIGPDAIRTRLASGQVYGGNWIEEAIAWLSAHDRSERDRSNAAGQENIELARTSKKAAVIAAITSVIAVLLTAIGIAVSFVAWLNPRVP